MKGVIHLKFQSSGTTNISIHTHQSLSLISFSKPLVLLTGATGFVGFLTLLELLKNVFRVRAAVRSQAKADNLRTNPVLMALDASHEDLNFTVIPNMAVQGAFNDAVHGV
ncbi:NAD dependent epimerase/dehydratase [Apiospora marii]|uniref:NAD dependent epimerase/dehydratase n=1 Tax=Apiospora marii TaxID=335849 RepID=A0ABR1SS19_9PEZI